MDLEAVDFDAVDFELLALGGDPLGAFGTAGSGGGGRV